MRRREVGYPLEKVGAQEAKSYIRIGSFSIKQVVKVKKWHKTSKNDRLLHILGLTRYLLERECERSWKMLHNDMNCTKISGLAAQKLKASAQYHDRSPKKVNEEDRIWLMHISLHNGPTNGSDQ